MVVNGDGAVMLCSLMMGCCMTVFMVWQHFSCPAPWHARCGSPKKPMQWLVECEIVPCPSLTFINVEEG
jgi:hypothetical protein